MLKRINPAVTVTMALLADAAMVLAGALFYGLLALIGLGLAAGFAQSLAKVSLDSTIQDGIPSHVQASAFARSDTTLQLAWVIGGFVGIAIPLVPEARPGGGVRSADRLGPVRPVIRPGARAPRPGADVRVVPG